MKKKPIVERIETYQFYIDFENTGSEAPHGSPIYQRGNTRRLEWGAIRIHSNVGVSGAYLTEVTQEFTTVPVLAEQLLGKSALSRAELHNTAKQILSGVGRMGLGVVDIALWDLAGKYFDVPVYELLGGTPRKLPCYASTNAGDFEDDGLNGPDAYADFAQACLDRGYPAFKMHLWQEASIDFLVETIHAVGQRVDGKMDLMIDPICAPQTWADALKLGRACDEENYLWVEDLYRDGGQSAHGHRKLRQFIKTPFLQLERMRGLEAHVDFIQADATDFVRTLPDFDGGITGAMKIAHATEGFGLDVEIHGQGPTQRHLMTSVHNTNYYEMGLLHPKLDPPPTYPPVYLGDYIDSIDAVDENGCVEVPEGPGLGVELDWDYITSHLTSSAVYE